jgi:hypothetical protein
MSYPYSLDLIFGSEKSTVDHFGRLSFGSGGDSPTPEPTESYWRTSSFNIKSALYDYIGKLGTFKSSIFSLSRFATLSNHLYYVKIGAYEGVEVNTSRLEQYKAWLSQAQISLERINDEEEFIDKVIITGPSTHEEWNVEEQINYLGTFRVDVNPQTSPNGSEFFLLFILAEEDGVLDPMSGESGGWDIFDPIQMTLTQISNKEEFSSYYKVDILSGNDMDTYLQSATLSSFGVGGSNEVSSTESDIIGNIDFPDGEDTNGKLESLDLINSFDVDMYENFESENIVAKLRFTLVIDGDITPFPPFFTVYEEDALTFEKVE